MTEALYERYKDALRRGHVAALRGQVDAALSAYDEASVLAPDRPLPHASRGTVLARAGRHDAAVEAFEVALRLAPRDELALAGRADSLTRAGRRIEAAGAYDQLAELHEAAGRLASACDNARRALEQAESKERRRRVERLTTVLRRAPGDADAEEALARALHVLEGSLSALPTVSAEFPTAELSAAVADEEADRADTQPAEPGGLTPRAARLDPELLGRDADVAVEAGDAATAGRLLLEVARLQVAGGHYAAAIDACHRALAVVPSDPDLHLQLAEIYVARGWRTLAADKLVLLARLIELADDVEARQRLCRLVASAFADDSRLAAICA